jgi:RnfABCDGE-type electron transport complex B subunit
VIQALAELTNTPIIPLDKNIQPTNLESTAIIDEEFCIGCTLCIDVCPIDSIIGSAKKTHSILNSLCSGCGLCLPPCPTNCIDIIPLNVSISRTKPASLQLMKLDQASRSKLWKEKYESKQARHKKKTLDLQKKASEESRNLTNLSKAQRIASAMDIARKKLVESQLN